ncbi:hypothetical protein CFK37_14045 [Virgibacillus phasianinus]|uniref:Aminodeoxychorismate lyase n=1 Tax=Virgibacillus phasianinus TaxID=2017483 RepID=A0A220U4Y6_9BACI|nr:endolytic transglycosylase MltG [Virgibacillus phasianinus]ASK63187.1 hypothetical protein CFK37_14045 [Virgibacillus phasianinus]
MKQPVRAFSIGLFAAGIILLAIFLYFDTPQNNTDNISQQEMIKAIEEDGYQVLSEDEYISLSVNNEPPKDQKNESKTKDKDKEQEKDQTDDTKSKQKEQDTKDKEKKEVKKFTLKVEPGLASSSISSILEENGVIDNASKFNKYLEENDYSQYVQLGTFELTTDMTFNQIAEAITN